MKKIQNGFFTILLILGLSSITANAQVNLSAHTASPGGVPHLTIMHLSDVLGEAGIANLQVTEGQTLTNSLMTLAEGKIDMSAMPIILPFLLDKGRGPFAKQGDKGAELAANVRALIHIMQVVLACLLLKVQTLIVGKILRVKQFLMALQEELLWLMHVKL